MVKKLKIQEALKQNFKMASKAHSTIFDKYSSYVGKILQLNF